MDKREKAKNVLDRYRYDVPSLDGKKSLGQVGYDAKKAMENGTIDNYVPKDYEKKAIDAYKQERGDLTKKKPVSKMNTEERLQYGIDYIEKILNKNSQRINSVVKKQENLLKKYPNSIKSLRFPKYNNYNGIGGNNTGQDIINTDSWSSADRKLWNDLKNERKSLDSYMVKWKEQQDQLRYPYVLSYGDTKVGNVSANAIKAIENNNVENYLKSASEHDRKVVENYLELQKKDNENNKAGFWEWVGDNFWAGLTDVSRGGGWLLKKASDFLNWIDPTEYGNDDSITDQLIKSWVDPWYDSLKNEAEHADYKAAYSNASRGGKWEFAGQFLQNTGSALPTFLMNWFSGGMYGGAVNSLSANSIQAATNAPIRYLVGEKLKQDMKSPTYWTSFVATVGSDYQQAIDNGATEYEATVTALLTSMLNASVETGSGLEKRWPDLLDDQKDKVALKWAKDFMKDSASEGAEEVVQGFVSNAMSKIMYDQDAPIFSMDDDTALINPNRMKEEFTAGTLFGAGMGGVQRGVAKGYNTVNNYYTTKKRGSFINSNSELADITIDAGLNSPAGSQAYKLAQKAVNNNNKLSNYDMGRLYFDIENQMAEAETATSNSSENPKEIKIPEAHTAVDAKTIEEKIKVDNVASSSFGKNGQKAFETNYHENQDAGVYAQGFNQFYRRGFIGQDYQTAESETQGTTFGKIMSADQKLAAYSSGVNDAKISIEQQKNDVKLVKSYGKEAGVVENTISKTYNSEVIKTVDRFAKAMGTKVEFVDTIENGTVNGSINDGYIQIAKDAYHEGMSKENIVSTVVGHEITHRIQQLAPEAYVNLRNYVAENNPQLVESVATKYAEAGRTISQESLLDEVTAEYTGYILKSPETINQFVDDARSGMFGGNVQQNMGVVKQLWQSVKGFVDKIKKFFKGNKRAQDKAAKDAFGMPMSELEHARDLLGKAFVESEKVVKEKNNPSQSAEQTAPPKGSRTPSVSKADSSLKDGAKKKDGDAKPEREYFKEAERDLNESKDKADSKESAHDDSGVSEKDVPKESGITIMKKDGSYSSEDGGMILVSEDFEDGMSDDKGEAKEKSEGYFKEPKDSEDSAFEEDSDGEKIRYSLKKHFNQQVDEAIGNTLKRGYRVYVGKTSPWLAKCGFNSEIPLLMNPSHIRDINHEKSPDNIHYHGLKPELIKQIPNELQNPVMIYDSITPEEAERKNAVCVVTKLKDGDGLPIIISVKANETDGAKYYDVTLETIKTDLYNFVASEYGKDDFFEHIENVIMQDALLYADKKKTLKLFSDSGLQLPTRLNSLGFDKIIHQSRNIVNPYSMQKSENNSGTGKKYSIKQSFYAEYDKWVAAERKPNITLTVGRTSDALRSIDVKEQKITWDTGKIRKTLNDHPYLDDNFIKRVPEILEHPIIVLQSKGKESRIVLFGEVNDVDGLPIAAVLELSPTNQKRTLVLDEIKVVSTHSRKSKNNPTSMNQTQNLIDTSEILYIDPNKNRTNNWLSLNGLQLPVGETDYGPIKSVTYPKGIVNTQSMQKSENNSGKKYSIKFNGKTEVVFERSFAEQVDEVLNSGKIERNHIFVGNTPSILKQIGLPDLPMLITSGHIKDMNHDEVKGITKYHGMSKELIKGIPHMIDNPAIIFDSISAGNANAICILSNKVDSKGRPIQIVIKPNGKGKYNNIEIQSNFLLSAYGKDNAQLYLSELEKKVENVIYVNKKRTQEMLKTAGLYLPAGLNKLRSDVIIHKTRQSVNSIESKKSIKMDDVLRQNATLKKAYTQLRMEYAKLQSGKKIADTKRIATVVKNLLDENGFSYNSARLTEQFEGLTAEAQAIFEGKMDFETFSGKVREVARAVIDEGTRSDSVAYQESKAVRDYLRTTKISLSAEDRANFGDEYETIRKGTFGRLRLVKEGGNPIDVAYQEMSELFPEYFSTETEVGASAQLRQIVSVLDGLQELKTDPFGGYADEAADWLSGMMIDRIFNEVFVSGSTGKVDVSVDMKALRESMGDNLQNIMNRERTWRTREYDKLQKKFEKKTKTYTESRQKAIKIKQVKLHTERISKALVNPSERFAVPEDLKKPVAEFLQCIDLTSDRMNDKTREQLSDLMAAYKAMAEQEYELNMVIDPDLYNNLQEISESIKALGTKDKRLSDLPLQTLEKLRTAVMAMEASLRNYNRAFREGKAIQIDALAEKAVSEIKELRKDNKKNSKIWGGASDLMNFDMLNPWDYFHQMGGTFEELFMGLRDGENKQIRNLALSKNYLDKVMKECGINPKKISGKKAKSQTFKLANGETVELTKAQIMSLHLLWRQNASHEHILEGGFRPAEVQQKLIEKKGEETKLVTKVSEDYSSVRPSLDDVAKILKTLSESEKKFAESISQFFTEECAEWGNEVAMKLYGYKKFNTPNYFPIVSDKMYLQEDFGVSADSTIKNTGFTKKRVKHANNPVIIEDIFDVYARHTSDMAKYNAYVLPLQDIQRVFNSSGFAGENNVKALIGSKYGRKAITYFSKLMNDINAGIKNEYGNAFASKMVSQYKKAKMGANVRVVIQQPMSYIRAAAIIDPKYLALASGHKVDLETVFKYSPIAQWKDWGFFSIDTGKSMYDLMTGKKELSDYTMALAGKADQMTWKKLWNAVERETAELHPELAKGSEAFYQAVGKRFDEVIDRTQVVDSTLHRSQILRSPDTFTKMSVSFMSEPMKTYNLLRTSVMDAVTRGDKKGLARTLTVTAISSILLACVTGGYDTLVSDDEDEEFWENFTSNLIGDYMGMIPYLKDITSILQGYDVKRMDMQGISDVVNAVRMFTSDKYTAQYKIANMSMKAADLFGIPVSSFKKSLYDTIIKNVLHSMGDSWIEYNMAKQVYPVNGKMKNDFVDILFEAYSSGQKDNFDKIRTDMVKEGLMDEDILNKVKNPFLDMLFDAYYLNDKAKYDEIVSDMMKYGYDAKSIESGLKSRKKDSNLYDALYEAQSSGNKEEFDRVLGELKVEEKELEIYNKLFEAQKANDQKEFDKILEELKTEDIGQALAFRREHGVAKDFFMVPWDNKMEIPEKESPDKFDLEDLDAKQYEQYSRYAVELENDVVDDIRGMYGDFDEETYYDLLSAAYNYVQNVAMEKTAPDEYDLDTEWILNAMEAEEKYGIEPSTYIRFKEEYTLTNAAFEGYEEVESSGIEFGEYLEFRDFYDNTFADKDANGKTIQNSKKRKIVDRLNEMELTPEEWDALFFKVAGYKQY